MPPLLAVQEVFGKGAGLSAAKAQAAIGATLSAAAATTT